MLFELEWFLGIVLTHGRGCRYSPFPLSEGMWN
jgi:hypothetical protein